MIASLKLLIVNVGRKGDRGTRTGWGGTGKVKTGIAKVTREKWRLNPDSNVHNYY